MLLETQLLLSHGKFEFLEHIFFDKLFHLNIFACVNTVVSMLASYCMKRM